MMKKIYNFVFIIFAFSAVMSARADLIMNNTALVGGCNVLNLGIYSGTSQLIPQFRINMYACNPGYYLPADGAECTICPHNHYCAGGDYQFNTVTDQGIIACADGLYAPAGMWESAQCGRILHIGDEVVYLRSVKKTTPSLNVDIDDDGEPDFFANITQLDVPMTRGTNRKIKTVFNNTTWSVYDDSVDLGLYENNGE